MLNAFKKLLSFNDCRWTFGYVFFSVCNVFVLLINPYLSQNFIDAIVSSSSDQAFFLAQLLFVFFVLGQFIGFAQDYTKGMNERANWEKTIKQADLNAVGYDPKKVHLTAGEVHQQLGQVYEMVKDYYMVAPVDLLICLVQEIAILVFLAQVSFVHAVCVGVLTPLFLLISNRYGNRLAAFNNQSLHDMKETRQLVADKTGFSLSDRSHQQSFFNPLKGYLDKYLQSKKQAILVNSIFTNIFSYAFLNIIILFSLLLSGYFVLQGKMTLGTLYAITLYVSRFWSPMENILELWRDYVEKKDIIKDFYTYLSPPKMERITKTVSSIQLINYVTLNECGNPLHQPLSVTFTTGNFYVLTGENGSGKTSLLLAMQGFSNRFQGEIIPNHQALNTSYLYSPAEPYDSQYFENKVVQNPSMGQKKMAQLKRDCMETKEVYFFDEPTNYLDSERKKQAIRMIQSLKREDRIILVVTHEKSLIQQADVVISLKQ